VWLLLGVVRVKYEDGDVEEVGTLEVGRGREVVEDGARYWVLLGRRGFCGDGDGEGVVRFCVCFCGFVGRVGVCGAG